MAKEPQQPRFLTSPAPIAKNGSEFNWIYLIGAAIGIVTGLLAGGVGIVLTLPAFLLAALIAKDFVLQFKKIHLSDIEFVLPAPVPFSVLTGELTSRLTPQGLTVEVNSKGVPVITHNNVKYTVSYNSNGTFSIWYSLSAGRIFLKSGSIAGNIRLYRKCVVSMGIIAYHVQQISAEYANRQAAAQPAVEPKTQTDGQVQPD